MDCHFSRFAINMSLLVLFTEQSIQSIFQDFALINSYLLSPWWIEHLFFIIITPRSSDLVENFLFYE